MGAMSYLASKDKDNLWLSKKNRDPPLLCPAVLWCVKTFIYKTFPSAVVVVARVSRLKINLFFLSLNSVRVRHGWWLARIYLHLAEFLRQLLRGIRSFAYLDILSDIKRVQYRTHMPLNVEAISTIFVNDGPRQFLKWIGGPRDFWFWYYDNKKQIL